MAVLRLIFEVTPCVVQPSIWKIRSFFFFKFLRYVKKCVTDMTPPCRNRIKKVNCIDYKTLLQSVKLFTSVDLSYGNPALLLIAIICHICCNNLSELWAFQPHNIERKKYNFIRLVLKYQNCSPPTKNTFPMSKGGM